MPCLPPHPLSGRLKGDVSEYTCVASQAWEKQIYAPLHLAGVNPPGTEIPTPHTSVQLQMEWGEHRLLDLGFQNQLARLSFFP